MQEWTKFSENVVSWLQEAVKESGAKGVILGLSGGLDSSVVAALCKKAFPGNSLALLLPCDSNPQDTKDAKEFSAQIGLETKEIDLCKVHEEMLASMSDKRNTVANGNLKARLRMCALYFFANKLNYLVIGTGNRTELELGYFTKYGDGAVDLLPLGGLLKREVRELAKALAVPNTIIEKTPSAGLWEGQTDEEELEMKYGEIDDALEKIREGKEIEVNPALLKKIKSRININTHKLNPAKIFSL